MLWACLHFPALALNQVEQTLSAPVPLVIETTRRQRRLVWQANALALAAGITPGMTVPSAQGLCRDLLCVPRNEAAELASLCGLGHWAYQFTPHIQLQNGDSLLLEVGQSLQLFHDRQNLANLLLAALPAGFQPCSLAFCATAFAALLLARAHAACAEPQFFELQDLPGQSVRWLNLADDKIALLESMGIVTLGQLFGLPHDALAKRFGQDFMLYLRRLSGATADVLPSWKLPDQFQVQLEFMHELDNTQQLLFPLRALLARLQDYLQARQSATTELRFTLGLRDRTLQRWVLALAAPHYRSAHMLPLLQLKLPQLQLQAPVLSVQLDVTHFVPLPTGQQDLLTPWQSDNVSRQQLVDKLQARLGAANVCGLGMMADHRPEQSWAACAPGAGNMLEHPGEHRPFWLLARPQPLRDKKGLPQYEGPLQLLKGPERIDTGWWDDQPVNRDYFVARQCNGRLLWIYRDRGGQQTGQAAAQQWYLHGIFGA